MLISPPPPSNLKGHSLSPPPFTIQAPLQLPKLFTLTKDPKHSSLFSAISQLWFHRHHSRNHSTESSRTSVSPCCSQPLIVQNPLCRGPYLTSREMLTAPLVKVLNKILNKRAWSTVFLASADTILMTRQVILLLSFLTVLRTYSSVAPY